MKGKGGFNITGQIGDVMKRVDAGCADVGAVECCCRWGWMRTC